ncbi:MAG: DUF4832 domain-containing protein [Pseudomonadota bacterium]
MPRTTTILPLSLSLAAALAMASLPAHAGKPRSGWDPVRASRSYSTLALSSDDTINPMHGYYRWQNQELVPQSAPAQDAYRRYYWRDLESAEGQYNFSAILAELQAAKNQGRKFALRIRMMAGYDDGQVYAPAYLVNNAQCQHGCGFWADSDPAVPGLTFVPDWNDPYLLQRSRSLLLALAQAIGPSENLAWIDVGMFGQYGEWAIKSGLYNAAPAGIAPVSNANKREFAKMHFDAFPTQQHVMFIPYANADALHYGLFEQTITSKPVGLRVDCLSRGGYFDQWTNRPAEWEVYKNQWQKAPFVAEFCPFDSGDAVNNPATARQQAAAFHISSVGNGNFAPSQPDSLKWSSLTPQEQSDMLMLGREMGYRYAVDATHVDLSGDGQLSLTTTLRNNGNAPSYEPWNVQVELRNSGGAISWSGTLALNLGALAGAGVSQSVQGSWRLPTLPADLYTLRLVARDSRASAGARAPLKWTIAERSGDGGLDVASLRRR